MYSRINIRYQIMLTLILVCVTSQSSLRNKRQQDPSETDYFSPLDESLRLDHLPVHDDTELEKIENDVISTPEGEIVVSTVPNDINDFMSNGPDTSSHPNSLNEVTEAKNIDQLSDYGTYFYDYNDYHYNYPENEDLLPNNQENLEKDLVEESIYDQKSLRDNHFETLNENETDVYDYNHHSELYAENPEIEESSNSEVNTETDQTESPLPEALNPSLNNEINDNDKEPSKDDDVENNNEDVSLYVDEPDKDLLNKSNMIAEDYENEAKIAPEPSVWFKQMVANDSIEEESHLTANCPDLNCEFGFKTDLYGKPICSCFNPCHEKKCGSNICKIEKITDSKFIGACYDPTKIERPIHCHLPLATGRCKNYTSRFYFNSFLQKCAHFVYTGCEGNHNNFETWEKCEMECNTCSLPAARGPCHGNIIRYYYDSLKRECVAFNWGGCKGNDNNFKTRKHCEDSCIFRKEGALFLHGMPIRVIRKYHQDQIEENDQN